MNGFEATNGKPFFEFLRHEPALWSTFDDAMAAGARMHALMLDKAVSWKSTRTICDVGGGTGELVRTLLDRHPDWHGTVFDLPEVVDRAVGHPRLQAVSGDAFTSIPDRERPVPPRQRAARLGRRRLGSDPRPTSPTPADAQGRVLVVENERRRIPRDDLALRADVLMASLTNGGRERTRTEFRTLGERAGLQLVNCTRLGSGDRAFEYRPRQRTTPAGTPRNAQRS